METEQAGPMSMWKSYAAEETVKTGSCTRSMSGLSEQEQGQVEVEGPGMGGGQCSLMSMSRQENSRGSG